MKPVIERDGNWIQVTESNNGCGIQSKTVEANLLFAILEKLEEIRCGLIDVENAVIPSTILTKFEVK